VERSPAQEAAEKETIDGHPTRVENYIVTQKGTGILTARVKLWEAEDLKGFPIRMDIDPPLTKKFTFYYTSVSLEKPDPKLFRVPAKCPKDKDETSPAPKSKRPGTIPVKPDAKSPSAPQ
jgi:hypothetical protein